MAKFIFISHFSLYLRFIIKLKEIEIIKLSKEGI